MAKTELVDLRELNLIFLRNNREYRIEFFKTSNKTVDIVSYENKKVYKKETIAFAQVPKNLKKVINPI
jgi:hypothetical protein